MPRAFQTGVIVPLVAGAALLGGCPTAKLSLNSDLTVMARLERATALRAAAYLVDEGFMRVNIEPDPDLAGSCGLSLFVRAGETGTATLEVRCPSAEQSVLRNDPGGAMGSVFEKTGLSAITYKCVFASEMLDFTLGDEAENAGCFQAETAEKKTLKGCFVSKGLTRVEVPKRLKPIVN